MIIIFTLYNYINFLVIIYVVNNIFQEGYNTRLCKYQQSFDLKNNID